MFFFFFVAIAVLTRRFSRNEYVSSPSKSEEVESNPLYGITTDHSISSSPISPTGSLHECENSLYNLADLQYHTNGTHEEKIHKEAIYEQPTTEASPKILTSPNISYNSLDLSIKGGKELKNPLYGTGTTTALPIYSAPRPSSSSLLLSSSDDPLPTEHPGYDTPTLISVDASKGEVFYETVDNNSSHESCSLANKHEEGTTYSQLDHEIHCIKPTHHLSDTDQQGYGQLQHH